VEFSVTGVGSVEAFEVVAITARVAGVVEKVDFSEGDVVTAGRTLVEIEPDRFRLSVASARAALDQAEAQKAEADMALQRRQQVNARNPDLVKEEDLEAYRTQVRIATADIVEKKAGLEMAELNLRDAFLKAPAAGVVQTRQVQTGQYVQPGSVLATMIRREPLLLRFRVPAQEAAALAPGQAAHFTVRGEERRWSARVTHVAAAADESSRMVDVTAQVDDPERGRLRPGSFAQVTVPIGEARTSPVVPQTAVRPSERGFLAFVVEDSTARERVLTLGLRTEDGRVEVKSGLSAGEMLVVRGAEALRDGAKIRLAGGGPS
jgi:multidrug efflux system membrane fusion protein